jgi:hypothetical protein
MTWKIVNPCTLTPFIDVQAAPVAKMEPRGHLPQSWNVTLREPTPEILK